MELLLTLMVGVIGGLIALKLKFPAGMMLGSLLAVSILNILTYKAFMPVEIKLFTQIISGLFIGSNLKHEDVVYLTKIIRPALLTIASLFVSCVLIGFLLYIFTDYNLATMLFSTAPGGLVDITLMSMDMEADTAVVSVLQITRLLTVVGLFPPLMGWMIRKFFQPDVTVIEDEPGIEEVQPVEEVIEEQEEPVSKKQKLKRMGLTFLIATMSGLIGYLSQLPAGTLMFAMIGTGIQSIIMKNTYMPRHVKKVAQVCAGALIGTSVTLSAILGMKSLIIPILLLIIFYFLMNLLLASILHKVGQLDWMTALFSCTPGGASDISLLAGDFGAKTSIVSTIQIMRSICVIAFYPFIIQWLNTLVNG
jgi:uncharacterized protein